jgi:hypothetical protein
MVSLLLFFILSTQVNSSEYIDKPQEIVKPVVKKESLILTPVTKYKDIPITDVYTDVLSHSKSNPYGDKEGRYTNVHETAHGIHNELRNTYTPLLKKRVNGFYCLNGQCAIVENPNLRIRHVQRYIPNILRSSKYKLYFVDQLEHWDDTPTYIFDEWNSYVLGAECAINDHHNKIQLEKTNAVSGALEFSIYSTALAMATKENDPVFWKTNYQFKAFVKYNLIRSERVFSIGNRIPEFSNKEQDRLYGAFLNHPDAEPIRVFLKTEFDGIFID